MLPVEVGDRELRTGLGEVRELIAPLSGQGARGPAHRRSLTQRRERRLDGRATTKVSLPLGPPGAEAPAMNILHSTSVAAALTAATLALPGAALAKGGGSTPPPPAAPPVLCDYAADGPTDAGTVFSNQAGDAGCITVISSSSAIRLYALALTPGWTADVKSNGEGTTGGVRVVFTQQATGQKVDAKIEPGRTSIR